MENARIADIFDRIADLLELRHANQFRVRSYRSAARTVNDLSRNLGEMVANEEDLTQLPTIGSGMSRKIKEIVERGTCKRLEQLQKEGLEGLIPIRFLTSDSHIRKIGHRSELVRGISKCSQMVAQGILELIERCEGLVGCSFFSQMLPHMLNRVEFRAIGRLRHQSDIFWNL